MAGPLRVSLYGLHGGKRPRVVWVDRLAPKGGQANLDMYATMCATCHGFQGEGDVGPSIVRHTQLADHEALTRFLETVPPPMPWLYPGLLKPTEIRMIADHLKAAIFKCDRDHSCGPPGKPRSGGTQEWRAIYSVLTHPRCLNCHPAASPANPSTDFPRQADDRHPHLYGVVRGADDRGAVVARCDTCHGPENNPATGVPGAAQHDGTVAWHLAPRRMAWETSPGNPMNSKELCAALKGAMSPQALLDHVQHEPLVLWAWNPGTRLDGAARTTPSPSHQDFVKNFTSWVSDGAPCPTR